MGLALQCIKSFYIFILPTGYNIIYNFSTNLVSAFLHYLIVYRIIATNIYFVVVHRLDVCDVCVDSILLIYPDLGSALQIPGLCIQERKCRSHRKDMDCPTWRTQDGTITALRPHGYPSCHLVSNI